MFEKDLLPWSRQRDKPVPLPADELTRAQPLEQRQHVAVLAVQHVRTQVDRVAAVRLGPAARAAAEGFLALEERHAQPGIAEGERAGDAREPSADDNHVLNHYNSPMELTRNKHAHADLHGAMQDMGRAARAAARELPR